ncbi:glycosyltransferase [Alteribacillus iranensis]|uniref:Glycosyltransferase involved in cell wall bisynthesis n=1 Tax=Alteribacillus iranensis TaxID=930128 RepID=A0A1I2BHA1_9BACI|nr:glycosyltransferase [Alteribacillus iranensis]SFE55317.1 Glycosyltransferase involved in cell wall bisynthesis [Alteribacillus iranensis]
MKLLFVHDTKLKEDFNGTYYTGGSYSGKVWDRYLTISSKLSIIARKEPIIYDVDVAKKWFNYFDKEKVNFIEVPNLNSSYKGFFNFQARKKIREIIKNAVLKTDFIIARLPSNNGNIAVYYAKKFNKPYLVEVVGCSWDALWNYNFKGKLLAPLKYFKQKNAIRGSKYAIYVTKSFLQSRYPTNGDSVNCSNVLLTDFDESVVKERIDKIKSLDLKSKLVIGTTAAVNLRYKGQGSVIKAIGKLKEQGITNFEYQLVGGGNRSYLSSIAKKYDVIEQVKFLGPMPHKEVLKWLESIDIYAQPSKTEGLPRALIEAMSRGVFAIGSNAGGIPELLEDKYIFSKAKNNELEVLNILKKVTAEDLLIQAQRNYRISKEYDKNVIELRRQLFFSKALGQT